MKSTTFTLFASLLLVNVGWASATQQINKRQEPAWSFSVYQSLERCTDPAADVFSGDHSQGCTTGFKNGPFGSFIVKNIKNGCTIGLYDTPDCAIDTLISVLTYKTEKKCLQGAEEIVNIPAFDVQCA